MKFKLFSNITLAFFAAILITFTLSCKKDNGNYSYKQTVLPTLANAGLAESYTIKQNQQLVIKPNVEYAGDTTYLEYQWLLYVKSTFPALGPPTYLSTAKNLDVLVTAKPGTYYLELIVSEKRSQFKVNKVVNLVISAGMEAGLLVLHSLNNTTDVDFITSTSILASSIPGHQRNIYSKSTGEKLPGDGVMISQSRVSNTDLNFVNVGTTSTYQRMHGFTFLFSGKDQSLFRRGADLVKPQAHFSSGAYEFLINDGKLHVSPLVTVMDALFSAPFRGTYYLEPYIAFVASNTYGAVVYDGLAKKFMYTRSALNSLELNFTEFKASTAVPTLFELNNMGMNLMYMETGYQNYTYAFLKNTAGTDYKLNVFTLAKADDGKLAIASYNMTALPEINQAKFFDVSTLLNVAFYATDRAIYRYSYEATGMAYKEFDAFPANEVITSFQLFKPKLNSNSGTELDANNNKVLFVATWNGTEGKVYEFSVNTSNGVINPTPVKTYTGFGRIKDISLKFRGTGI